MQYKQWGITEGVACALYGVTLYASCKEKIPSDSLIPYAQHDQNQNDNNEKTHRDWACHVLRRRFRTFAEMSPPPNYFSSFKSNQRHRQKASNAGLQSSLGSGKFSDASPECVWFRGGLRSCRLDVRCCLRHWAG